MITTATPTHFICDPCYVLHTIDPEGVPHSEGLWVKSFCEALSRAEEKDFDGHFTYMGHPLFVHDTAYGDGSYKGSDGRSYSVDAGIIGAIPVKLIEDEVVQQMLKQPYVRAVSMTECELSMAEYHEGTFTFYTSEGRLTIETDPEEEYKCEDCGDEISEYEYNDEAMCSWCVAEREEQEREEDED